MARGTRAAMLSLRTAVRTRRIKSVAVRLAALCAAMLVLGFAGFVWLLPSGEVVLDRNADGIVVLTGGTSRVTDALELLADHRGKRLLITGVNPGTTTGEIARQVPDYQHILACCVDLDYSAINTLGNAVQARRWATQHGFHSLIVVTSAYHMPRALAELAHQLPDVALIPFPVVSDRLRVEPWWSNGATTRLVLSEYLKYLFAELRMRFELIGGGQREGPRIRRASSMRSRGAPADRFSQSPNRSAVSRSSALLARSLAVQRAVLCELDRSHDRGAADACAALSDPARLYSLLCPQQSLAVAGRLRHQGAVARARKDSPWSLHRRLQASILVGDIRALRRAGRSDLHPQARVDVDSAVRLAHVEGGTHSDRPQRRIGGAGAHDGAGAAKSSNAPARSSSFRKARGAPRAPSRATSRALSISMARPASPACRWRSIPDCFGRADRYGAFPAPFWLKRLIRSRPASKSACSLRACRPPGGSDRPSGRGRQESGNQEIRRSGILISVFDSFLTPDS